MIKPRKYQKPRKHRSIVAVWCRNS